ncbi:SUMF1/EgtB/PvdO family nonheme iron enzyme [Thalassotalea atypica]|uniref:SUMF1/EgtB/PvdO family nonheme iron enzyme n=1 Tax=Thalassotalea atypica TaxID=2054316 RepID=UPI0025723CD5|nr:SUMF1/EgtB/PvdO family nonheme iron enzyme [Thalassotalea atypica]
MKKSFALLAALVSASHAYASTKPIEPVLVPLVDQTQSIDIHMSKYEVTVAEFTRFANATGYQVKGECHLYNEKHTPNKKHGTWNNPDLTNEPFRPVVCLGATDAMAYADWLAKITQKPYRLAKFNEWKLAASAGQTSRFAFGDDLNHSDICDYENTDDFAHNAGLKQHHGYRHRFGANCNDGATYHTVVGMYRPNSLGLYDMMGNVREITQTCSETSKSQSSQCSTYVVAGGAWHWLPHPQHMKNDMVFVGSIEGFRLVLDSNETPAVTKQTQHFMSDLAKAQQQTEASHLQLKKLPLRVRSLRADLISDKQVKVSWSPSKNEDVTYTVYRSYLDVNGTLSREMTKLADNIKKSEYLDTLPSKGLASYQVFANNAIGESQPSSEVYVGQQAVFNVGERIQAEFYHQHHKAEVISKEEQQSVFLSSNDGHYPPGMFPYSPAWLSYELNSERSGTAQLKMNVRGHQGAVIEFWQGKSLIATVTLSGAREFSEVTVAAQLKAGNEPIQIRGADHNYVMLDWFELQYF